MVSGSGGLGIRLVGFPTSIELPNFFVGMRWINNFVVRASLLHLGSLVGLGD